MSAASKRGGQPQQTSCCARDRVQAAGAATACSQASVFFSSSHTSGEGRHLAAQRKRQDLAAPASLVVTEGAMADGTALGDCRSQRQAWVAPARTVGDGRPRRRRLPDAPRRSSCKCSSRELPLGGGAGACAGVSAGALRHGAHIAARTSAGPLTRAQHDVVCSLSVLVSHLPMFMLCCGRCGTSLPGLQRARWHRRSSIRLTPSKLASRCSWLLWRTLSCGCLAVAKLTCPHLQIGVDQFAIRFLPGCRFGRRRVF